jgi:hypothetical protein
VSEGFFIPFNINPLLCFGKQLGSALLFVVLGGHENEGLRSLSFHSSFVLWLNNDLGEFDKKVEKLKRMGQVSNEQLSQEKVKE